MRGNQAVEYSGSYYSQSNKGWRDMRCRHTQVSDSRVTMTRELVAMGLSKRGAYTKRQLEFVGVPWPPPRGWLRALIGDQVCRCCLDGFLGLVVTDLVGTEESVSARSNRSFRTQRCDHV